MPRWTVTIVALALLSGCATPTAVKELSVRQSQYMETLHEAVAAQSAALILAAERIAVQAQGRIEAIERERRHSLTELIATGNLDRDRLDEATARIARAAREAGAAQTRLDSALGEIRAHCAELEEFVVRLKQVQMALDGYVQSRRAGEVVVEGILEYPGLEAMVASVNALVPRVRNGIRHIGILLDNLDGGSP